MKTPSKARVLLIEPDVYLANKYQKILQSNHVCIFHFTTAGEAINNLDKVNPDLIILEVLLKGNNGIEFIYELRSYSDLQNLPVILLTYLPKRDFNLSIEQEKILKIKDYLCKTNISLIDLITSVKRELKV